jgi:iron-sulfur cluster insertion protein
MTCSAILFTQGVKNVNALLQKDLAVSATAVEKLSELLGSVEDEIAGIRVYATAGGCSGISFGMTFADSINDNDMVGEHGSVKVIVDADTIGHLRGAEIDFIDRGDGNAAFVFNNIPQPAGGGGCGSCGSSGGGCA